MELTKAATDKITKAFDPLLKRIHRAEALIKPNELDEEVFVRVFLPFFAGEKDLMYFKDDDASTATEKALLTWNNVAGGLFNEVSILGTRDGTRQIVCTVPSILNRNLVKPTVKYDNEPSIYGAVLTTANIVNHSPQQAEHYLQNYLKRRQARMWNVSQLVHNADVWNAIFTMYGRQPMVPLVAGTPEETNKGDEVIGFDPL